MIILKFWAFDEYPTLHVFFHLTDELINDHESQCFLWRFFGFSRQIRLFMLLNLSCLGRTLTSTNSYIYLDNYPSPAHTLKIAMSADILITIDRYKADPRSSTNVIKRKKKNTLLYCILFNISFNTSSECYFKYFHCKTGWRNPVFPFFMFVGLKI